MEKGKFYYKDGDLDKASYHFSLSLELEETPENLFYMGLISSQKLSFIEALNYFYRSVEMDSEYGNPCNEIGVILLRHGREREAVFWLKRSIRCKNNDAPHIPLYNLATLYKMWNRPERSLQYLHKAIELAPEFEEAIRLRDEITSSNL
jgi:tetratricopeptide (TPR) repeat protein